MFFYLIQYICYLIVFIFNQYQEILKKNEIVLDNEERLKIISKITGTFKVSDTIKMFP